MSRVFFLGLLITIAPVGNLAFAAQSSSARGFASLFNEAINKTPLGMTEEDFKRAYPNAKKDEISIKMFPSFYPPRSAIYKQKLMSPLFPEERFQFADGRLVHISFLVFEALDNWEVAEKVVRFGKTAIDSMHLIWGEPFSREAVWSIRTHSERKMHSARLRWRISGAYIMAEFPPAQSLLSEAGLDTNVRGAFTVIISTFPRETKCEVRIGCRPGVYDESMVNFDYKTYQARMKIKESIDSKRLFPQSIKGVYIGMSLKHLKNVRPKAKVDRFLSSFRSPLRESLGESFFYRAEYKARMDRVVSVSLLAEGGLAKLAKWCQKKWGLPSAMYLHQKSKRDIVRQESLAFLWRLQEADVALKFGVNLGFRGPYEFEWIKIFEKDLPLDIALDSARPPKNSDYSGRLLKDTWKRVLAGNREVILGVPGPQSLIAKVNITLEEVSKELRLGYWGLAEGNLKKTLGIAAKHPRAKKMLQRLQTVRKYVPDAHGQTPCETKLTEGISKFVEKGSLGTSSAVIKETCISTAMRGQVDRMLGALEQKETR